MVLVDVDSFPELRVVEFFRISRKSPETVELFQVLFDWPGG